MTKTVKTGTIFDIKKYAIHDGPGIRTTVFFKGCPLRCRWCHNPEGQRRETELTFKENRCIDDCDECITSCKREALSLNKRQVSINRKACNLCKDCAEACPTGALEIIGRRATTAEAMREILKDRIFYEESSGGVTFSGGEPLLQPAYLNSLLSACRENGLHTSLDTSGYAPPAVLEKVSDGVDLFLYDLKLMDENLHREYTGVSNRLILENLEKLSGMGKAIIIRIPVIPGVNDSKRNTAQTAGFISRLKGIQSISLLPYHKIGRQKYQRLNTPYTMEGTQSPGREKIQEITMQLEEAGFKVKTGD